MDNTVCDWHLSSHPSTTTPVWTLRCSFLTAHVVKQNGLYTGVIVGVERYEQREPKAEKETTSTYLVYRCEPRATLEEAQHSIEHKLRNLLNAAYNAFVLLNMERGMHSETPARI